MLFVLAGFLLVFAPLVLGGNRPQPLLLLELAGVAGIAALAQQGFYRVSVGSLPAGLRWGVGLLVCVPLLQLVPLPAGWWSQLPGHGPYFRALEFAGESAMQAMRRARTRTRTTG